MTIEITQEIAKKVRDTVRIGLVRGLGKPIPGKMCVEAAVCYALGLDHGDNPPCVARSIRRLKMRLNDSRWSSDEVRAKGMIRLSLLQLGTETDFDAMEFARRLVPLARTMAQRVEQYSASYAAASAYAASAYAAYYAASYAAADAASATATAASYAAAAAANADEELLFFASQVEEILISMNVPGVQWLALLD